ncbi:MAG: pepsin/retropepsin-like aspartic protease family protein [Verrucomicrobia bacterium]|nr:pepsin/retropepsin-like aspartic protease family protein [Verrucomicrobiota bacterium]
MRSSLFERFGLAPLATLLAGLLVFQSGCQSLSIAPSQARGIRAVIGRYQEALNQRSAEKLFALLGETIQVDGMTDEMSRAGLKAGMHWPPAAITRFQILSISKTRGGLDVKAAFYFSNAVLQERLGFDDSLRIRTIDPVPVWKTPEAQVIHAFSSPFAEANGLMFVRARVNERTGFFLFDTGSSGLLLNKEYFSSDSRNELPGFTSTVQGIKPRWGTCGVRSFGWGQLHVEGIRGQLHDFSMMETPAISPLLGAIGHEQLKKCAVVFDWKNRRLDVRTADGNSTGPRSAKAVIPFSYFLHAPSFPIKIGETTRRVIFDSGAQINLLPNVDGIESHFHKIDAVTKISDGGKLGKETALLGLADETWIGGVRYQDLPYAVFEVPYLSGQGILGSPLIQRGLLEINFPKKTLSLW